MNIALVGGPPPFVGRTAIKASAPVIPGEPNKICLNQEDQRTLKQTCPNCGNIVRMIWLHAHQQSGCRLYIITSASAHPCSLDCGVFFIFGIKPTTGARRWNKD